METVILVCCGLGVLIGYLYLLTEIRAIAIEEKMKMQYIQCKLSNVETNLSLVQYLLKRISK